MRSIQSDFFARSFLCAFILVGMLTFAATFYIRRHSLFLPTSIEGVTEDSVLEMEREFVKYGTTVDREAEESISIGYPVSQEAYFDIVQSEKMDEGVNDDSPR